MVTKLANASFDAEARQDPQIATMLRRTANKVDACGRVAFCSICEVTHTPHLTVPTCKSRFCPSCQITRSRALQGRIRGLISRLEEKRFLTLTLKHSNAPLRVQMQRLTRCFAKLRRKKKSSVAMRGGIYTIEITRNHKTQQWHPHLHAIVDGDYVDVRLIASEWHQITGDSSIVDLRFVYNNRSAAAEISKYCGKCMHPENLRGDSFVEYADALASMRMIETFGTVRQMKITDEPPPERTNLRRICTLAAILAHAKRGDAVASRLARAWAELANTNHTSKYDNLAKETIAWHDATGHARAIANDCVETAAEAMLYDAQPPPDTRALGIAH